MADRAKNNSVMNVRKITWYPYDQHCNHTLSQQVALQVSNSGDFAMIN